MVPTSIIKTNNNNNTSRSNNIVPFNVNPSLFENLNQFLRLPNKFR